MANAVYPDGMMEMGSSSSMGSLVYIVEQDNMPVPPYCDQLEVEDAVREYMDALNEDDEEEHHHHHIVFNDPPSSPPPQPPVPVFTSSPVNRRIQ